MDGKQMDKWKQQFILMLILLEVLRVCVCVCVCIKFIIEGELETVWFCFISGRKSELDNSQFLFHIQLP